MRLAFCLNKYFPFGGLQANFLRIACLCRQGGHEVVVYSRAWEGAIPADLEVHIIPVRALTNHGKNAEFARKLQPLLQQGGFDGVIGFMKMPGLDIYYAADPCFQAKARERSRLYRLSPRYRSFLALEKAVFDTGTATDILVLTGAQREVYSRCYPTLRERFHLLPPGIPRDRQVPPNAAEIRADFRQEFALTAQEIVLLTVGSGFRTKGLGRTLRALAALPGELLQQTRLLVVGEGKTGPFRRLAGRLGVADRVAFMGGRQDIPRFLLGADLLIHPAYTETTGNVLLEAMVAGLPVLTTANCGYALQVEQARAGVVLPVPLQQPRLNAALAQMLVSPERPRWSHNGIAYGHTEDLYSRPEVAVQLITAILQRRRS
jgi:UDP-glucose:(heptosyl)LPS alpha-1,3-glucosyltransferase